MENRRVILKTLIEKGLNKDRTAPLLHGTSSINLNELLVNGFTYSPNRDDNNLDHYSSKGHMSFIGLESDLKTKFPNQNYGENQKDLVCVENQTYHSEHETYLEFSRRLNLGFQTAVDFWSNSISCPIMDELSAKKLSGIVIGLKREVLSTYEIIPRDEEYAEFTIYYPNGIPIKDIGYIRPMSKKILGECEKLLE